MIAHVKLNLHYRSSPLTVEFTDSISVRAAIAISKLFEDEIEVSKRFSVKFNV